MPGGSAVIVGAGVVGLLAVPGAALPPGVGEFDNGLIAGDGTLAGAAGGLLGAVAVKLTSLPDAGAGRSANDGAVTGAPVGGEAAGLVLLGSPAVVLVAGELSAPLGPVGGGTLTIGRTGAGFEARLLVGGVALPKGWLGLPPAGVLDGCGCVTGVDTGRAGGFTGVPPASFDAGFAPGRLVVVVVGLG